MDHDQVWSIEVSTAHGHKVYHAAFESESEAKDEVLKINADESPVVEGVGLAENLWHLRPGTARQVLP
jgi:hypothetical protein